MWLVGWLGVEVDVAETEWPRVTVGCFHDYLQNFPDVFDRSKSRIPRPSSDTRQRPEP